MKIMLLNRTDDEPHIGCHAVSSAHKTMLSLDNHEIIYNYFNKDYRIRKGWNGNLQKSTEYVLSTFKNELEQVDCIIVNGEGTLHHNRGLWFMSFLNAGQLLNKKTLIVNSVFQEMKSFDIDVLLKLDDFTVRDLMSSNYLETLKVPHRIVLDSFLEANWTNKITHDFENKIAMTDWHPDRNFDVGKAMTEYKEKNPNDIIDFPLLSSNYTTSWSNYVANISTAKLLITARHHGVYLAGLAGLPFVALPGNSYKIEGTIALSKLPLPICLTLSDLEAGISFALKNPTIFIDFQQFLIEQKPLTTFAAIKI